MSSDQLTVKKDGLGGTIWTIYMGDKPVATVWPSGEVTGRPELRKKLETVVGVTYALNDLSKFTEEEMLGFLTTTVALID